MAKLGSLRQNTARINDGAWVTIQMDNGETFRILTRGATAAYQYRLNALQRAAAAEFNRSLPPGTPTIRPDELPPPLANRCFGHAMADETFIDVAELYHPGPDDETNGAPVTADEFREMLRNQDEYMFLILYALQALGSIQAARQEDAHAAVGNSASA